MEAFIWSERFVTGLPQVDEQHQKLVGLINSLEDLNARSGVVPRAQLEAVVDELASYARTHFIDEEALMDAEGVDARFSVAHRAKHARFLRDVMHMRDQNFLAAAETSRVLLRFLLQWLAFHILGTDMQLARQVERIRRGEPAADAFAEEVHDAEGPAQLLLAALDDLMRVIAERNAQLTEANRTLELRVEQRTAELSASVEALRATQVRLVESEKLASVGQLASGLAHEINNPLGFIRANLGVLGEHARALLEVVEVGRTLEPALPAAQAKVLAEAHARVDIDFVSEDLEQLLTETTQGVDRVQGIVQDLKNFTHVDGSAVMDVDLATAITTTLKMLPAALRSAAHITTAFGQVPRVPSQAAQVNQALFNIIQNAAQAVRDRTDGTGEVIIRTGVDGEEAFVEVKDSGVGMTAEVLAHVFEPFFTTRAPGQGTGLGLNSAYNCAQAHGGRLEASSILGKGSTLRLSLPLHRAQAAAVPNSLSNPFNARRYAQG